MRKRKSKPVSESAIENCPTMIFPEDLNPQDRMFGGMLVAAMDKLAASIFFRHTEGQSCGTRLIGEIPFKVAAYKGDLLLLNASINRVWGSSCEIGVRANIQRKTTGAIHHISSTFFTYVATEESDEINPETDRPKLKSVPIKFAVRPASKEERRRFKDADERRKARIEKENGKTRD